MRALAKVFVTTVALVSFSTTVQAASEVEFGSALATDIEQSRDQAFDRMAITLKDDIKHRVNGFSSAPTTTVVDVARESVFGEMNNTLDRSIQLTLSRFAWDLSEGELAYQPCSDSNAVVK